MYDLEEENDDISVRRILDIDSAIKCNVSKDEIQLYEQLSLAMELMEDEKFKITDSILKQNRIYFSVATPYPNGLPENIAILFFNINNDYNVQINECKCVNDLDNRHFAINLIKS
jgi:hypothetical protein